MVATVIYLIIYINIDCYRDRERWTHCIESIQHNKQRLCFLHQFVAYISFHMHRVSKSMPMISLLWSVLPRLS